MLYNPFSEEEQKPVSNPCEKDDHYWCSGWVDKLNEKCACYCHKNLHDEPEQ